MCDDVIFENFLLCIYGVICGGLVVVRFVLCSCFFKSLHYQ